MTQQRPRLEDLEAIRHRYAAERDKRIREDGNDQYEIADLGNTSTTSGTGFRGTPSTKPSTH